MEILGVASFPSIVILCYLFGLGIKSIPNEKINAAIPFFVGLVGAGLGAVAYFAIPGMANNLLMALAIGVVSGLASTGINQLIKQANKVTDKE